MQPKKSQSKDAPLINAHAAVLSSFSGQSAQGVVASPTSAPVTLPITSTAAQEEPPLLKFTLARPHVVVRLIQESDTRALEWHGGADLRAFYEQQWQQHCAGAVCVLVADFNGFPVGQGSIHWQGKPTHRHIPDIQSLRVFDAFRGLGVGSQLLSAGERLVAARGFGQVSLAVGTQNPAARRLYERLGYRAVGEPYNDAWHYINAQDVAVHVEEMVIDLVKNLVAE